MGGKIAHLPEYRQEIQDYLDKVHDINSFDVETEKLHASKYELIL